MLSVVKSGPRSLIQDLGRFGQAELGVSQGGPLDIYAFCNAQYLLGNTPNSPALEIALGGAAFTFQAATSFAITGAEMNARLNAKPLKNWASYAAKSGDRLTFDFSSLGNIAYLAVLGGFHCESVLGSVSTVVRNQLGGLDTNGSSITNGDVIPFRASEKRVENKLAAEHIPKYDEPTVLGVLPGYQQSSFSSASIQEFYENAYTILSESDRMGIRLSGPRIEGAQSDGISEGIALGAIQVTPEGQPIVLMHDRQSIGGYPKLGCVQKMDLWKLAQARIGSDVRFKPRTLESARSSYSAFEVFFGLRNYLINR